MATTDLSKHKNATVRELWGKIAAFLNPLHDLYTQYKNASPPSVNTLDAEILSSDDPKVIEFREAIKDHEKAIREIREEGHKYLLKNYDSLTEEELQALRTKFQEGSKRVVTTIGMLRDYCELMEVDGVVDQLKELEVPTLRGTGRVTGGASGTSNIRAQFKSVTVTYKGKTKTVDRLSQATNFTGHDNSMVFAALMREADVPTWQDIKDVVAFDFGTEPNNASYEVTPKGADDNDSDNDNE